MTLFLWNRANRLLSVLKTCSSTNQLVDYKPVKKKEKFPWTDGDVFVIRSFRKQFQKTSFTNGFNWSIHGDRILWVHLQLVLVLPGFYYERAYAAGHIYKSLEAKWNSVVEPCQICSRTDSTAVSCTWSSESHDHVLSEPSRTRKHFAENNFTIRCGTHKEAPRNSGAPCNVNSVGYFRGIALVRIVAKRFYT